MKNIIRLDKKGIGNYTAITNDILQSKKLNSKQFHILCYLLSLPENFVIHKTSIWKNLKIGRGSFESNWIGLTELGYIQTTKLYDNKTGQFNGYRHIVFEVPQLTENRGTGKEENIEPVHRKPVHRNLVNQKSVSIIINKEKEIEIIDKEKTSGGARILDHNTGTNRVEDSPPVTLNLFLIDENKMEPVNTIPTKDISEQKLRVPYNNIPTEIKGASTGPNEKEILKNKILNLDFLKQFKEILGQLDSDRLVEFMKTEFPKVYSPTDFEKRELDIIINKK